ncbi:TerC/Alx family metal homeostasis membrane protein [Bacteroidota bacterium]
MANGFFFWILFVIVISIMFYIDLYVTDHRKGIISLKSSLIWSAIWITLALTFNVVILLFFDNGEQKAVEFLAGYLIEKSLSVDNLFVFIMIFSVMSIKPINQPHILKWGILSAIVMRIIFILSGVTLIELFHPVIYLFGLLLLYSAYKMAFGGEHKIDLENNLLINFFSKRFNIKTNYDGKNFFIRENGYIYITATFLTLLLIESADLVFAIDSIPAVIAITHDPFIIITSNIFAILGLRALYFALAGIIDIFIYLKYGVAVILAYVGIKMLIVDLLTIPTLLSLLVIIICLTASIILSVMFKRKSLS